MLQSLALSLPLVLSLAIPAIATETQTDADQLRNTTPATAIANPRNYIGIAGDMALDETNTSLEKQFNGTFISRFKLSDSVSIRPSVRVADDPVFNVPVTYDFNRDGVSPYIGGGANIKTGDTETEKINPLATVGADIPINENITANTALNAVFDNRTELRVTAGIGYNF